MLNLSFAPSVEHAASRSLLISGCARSGTTLMGKLIGSAKNVEYFFEPESLIGLYSVASSISSSVYQTLFTSMLIEHLCANSLSGRNLNFNPNDDSYIFSCKSEDEVSLRMQKSWRREDILECVSGVVPAFKIPSILACLPNYHFSCFPSSRVICVVRDPHSIYRSIQQKKWFSGRANVLFPFFDVKLCNPAQNVPYWVERESLEEWPNMSGVKKFSYYYSLVYKAALNSSSLFYVVDYSKFVLNPFGVASSLFDLLRLEFGCMTRSILESVDVRSPGPGDFSLDEKCELDRLLPLYDALVQTSVS